MCLAHSTISCPQGVTGELELLTSHDGPGRTTAWRAPGCGLTFQLDGSCSGGPPWGYLVLSCTHHPFCIHVLTRLFQSTLNFLRPGKIFFSGVFPGLRARINKYYLSNRRSTSKARLLGRSVCLPSFIMMTLI